ncbi:hypothetical protein FRZ67_13590 [Panacibacter ginsenosidivorans]|uniref:DUF4331 domain-containing protein n=1 Tax=Panacibacter ginsenosidivorans TaxID=1813871 RepID=A0A5B8VBI1_9BACT|nr:hypothetical protein [Panacibacter ginsenosidivorans]QEC68281.1 hypothetical protein FRZ67_13590 [Panacibacter ginsenosidivorans]
MKTIRIGVALLAITLIAFSCSKTELNKPQSQALSAGALNDNSVAGVCGEPIVYTLSDCNGLQYGTLSVSNDDVNLFVTFDVTNPDYKIQKSSLVIGTLAHVTAATDDVAWPKLPKGPYPPDFSNQFKPELSSYTYTIPLSNYESCFDISAFAKLLKRDPVTHKPVDAQFIILQSSTKTGTKKWSTYVEYCKQDCPPPPCGQLTTYTQGGYGNDQGNGTGTAYMIANFDGAFPGGVTVGCSGGFTMVMTNSGAVQTYLPSSSTPAVLTQNYTDDGPNTVLGGQLLTLALSVGFDNYDPNFGAGTQHLADMVIASGDFQGMTVGEFLAIANDVFGGCSTDYTPDQINVAATAINENYDEGKVDNGFLNCPNN